MSCYEYIYHPSSQNYIGTESLGGKMEGRQSPSFHLVLLSKKKYAYSPTKKKEIGRERG